MASILVTVALGLPPLIWWIIVTYRNRPMFEVTATRIETSTLFEIRVVNIGRTDRTIIVAWSIDGVEHDLVHKYTRLHHQLAPGERWSTTRTIDRKHWDLDHQIVARLCGSRKKWKSAVFSAQSFGWGDNPPGCGVVIMPG